MHDRSKYLTQSTPPHSLAGIQGPTSKKRCEKKKRKETKRERRKRKVRKKKVSPLPHSHFRLATDQ